MLKRLAISILAAALFPFAAPARADEYNVDGAHAGITFKIEHLELSYIFGRFNEFSGNFTIEEDPSRCSFSMEIKTESVDTGNKARDNHLRGPDFFNAKQFPTISFKSTNVKSVKQGYEVTGDMTLHGVTKSVTFILSGGKQTTFQGAKRTGFSTDFTVKRSDFGMSKFIPAAGDEVRVAVSFEGVAKK